jgi:AcrR family transcriptional regulator
MVVRTRSGRRAGDSGSREAILAAARARFASHGYDGATIRAIAGDAGVDPALVHHYFGNKEQLFIAALELPIDPRQVTVQVVKAGPRAEMGERMIRFFLHIWGDERSRAPMLAMIRTAATNEEGARTLRQFATSAILSRVADNTGVPRLRIEAAVAQMIGIALLRYVIKVEPMASASDEEVIALVAPLIQRIIDEA